METHQDQPTFHLFAGSGWVNDPNGPLFYKGKYHLFFQNVDDSTTWTWGLSWGHATSTDLLHWRQQPPALKPEPGWHDADGCFSGCATVDTDGRPAILYTGVRKKPDAAEREGMPMTVSKLCYETQLIARPKDTSDPDLKEWVKVCTPFLPDDMSGLPTHCFRDPFVLDKPNESNGWRWRVMVGSNISLTHWLGQDMMHTARHSTPEGHLPTVHSLAGSSTDESPAESSSSSSVDGLSAAAVAAGVSAAVGHEETLGTATVYRSRTKELEGGWDFDGLLCVAQPGDGAIWECPIMVPLSSDQHQPTPEDTSSTAAAATATVAAAAAAAAAAAPPLPSAPPLPAAAGAAGLSKQQQQQQQQLELERVTSGCLRLWSPPNTPSSSSSSNAAAAAAAASPTNPAMQQQQQLLPPTHLFSVSAGVCPAIYWLGRYADGRFDLSAAEGPLALDLGDVFYAPNLLEDAQGRQVIWGWCQDHPSPFSHDYAGCISLPRQLTLGIKHTPPTPPPQPTTSSSSTPPQPTSSSSTLRTANSHSSSSTQPLVHPHNDAHHHQQQQQQAPASAATSSQQQQQQQQQVAAGPEYYLIQRPLPELDRLRSGRGLRLRGIVLPPDHVWSLPSQVSASHLDLCLTLQPRPGVKHFQILLGPLRKDTDTPQQQQQQVADASPAGPQEASSTPAAAAGPAAAAAAGSTPAAATAAAARAQEGFLSQAFVPVGRTLAGTGTGVGPSSLSEPASLPAAAAAAPVSDETVSRSGASSHLTLAAFAAGSLSTTSINSFLGSGTTGGHGAAAAAAAAAASLDGEEQGLRVSRQGLGGGDSFIGSETGFNGGGMLSGLIGGTQAARFESPPGSPTAAAAAAGQEVLPWLPVATGAGAAGAGSTAAGAGSSSGAGVAGGAGADTSDAATQAAAAAFGSSSSNGSHTAADLSSPPAAERSAGSAADRANGSTYHPTSPPHTDSAAALAAAAAAEALAQEHWQAAALTYDFDSHQLQVLVGHPDALLKILKQQADQLTAAAATAAAGAATESAGCQHSGPEAATFPTGSSSSSAGGQDQQQQQQQLSSRTGTPTPEKLGFDTPALPPAPSGCLAGSIAAAEASGLRVLACQLRGLDPGQPLEVRVLLDYSIMEVFFGTGEALTTRVYRGAPTARAAEMAARRSAATLSAAAAEASEDTASEVSMSGSLANLGLLLHHTHSLQQGNSPRSPHRQLQHSLSVGSPRLRSRRSSSLSSFGGSLFSPPKVRNSLGGFFSPAGRHSFDVASLPSLASTAGAAATGAEAGASAGGVSSPRRRSFGPQLPTFPPTAEGGAPLTPSTAAAAAAAGTGTGKSPPLPSADPTQSALFQQAPQPLPKTRPQPHQQPHHHQQQQQPVITTTTTPTTQLSTPFSPPPPRGSVSTRQVGQSAVPPSPAGGGPYVHYFSPHRSLAARVTGRTDAAALLPGLAADGSSAAGIQDSRLLPLPAAAPDAADAVGLGGAAPDAEGVEMAGAGAGAGRGAAEGQLPAGAPLAAAATADRRQRRPLAEASFSAGVTAQSAADDAAAAAGSSSSSSSSTGAAFQPAAPSPEVSASACTSSTSTRRGSKQPVDAFPGFSPHRAAPTAISIPSDSSSGNSGSSSSTAGALVTWFQKKLSSRGCRGESAGQGGSSTSTSVKHQIVLPTSFGVPPPYQPSPFAPAPAAPAIDAGPTGAVRDQDRSRTASQQRQKQQKQASQAEAAAAAADSSSTAAVLAPPAALPTLQIRTAAASKAGGGSSSAGSTPAAAAAVATAVGAGSHGDASSGGVTSPTAGGTSPMSPIRSPRSARAAGRAGGARKNWRAAFVFDAEDEEAAGGAAGTTVPGTLASFASWPGGPPTSSRVVGTASGTVSGTVRCMASGTVSTAGGASHTHLTGSVSDAVGALLQQPGFEGGRVLVSTMQQPQVGPAGSSHLAISVWQSEYGLYAQLLAPGSGPPGVTVVGPSPKTAAGAALTAGAGGPPSAADGAGGLGGGVVRVPRLAALGGKPPQSGYSAGSMRECSLVALGGGGVTVQRLEAYEMASMWDPQGGL